MRHFTLQETTIAGLHDAVRAGEITFEQVTEMYLARIGAYNLQGPGINAVVTVNPDAAREARRLDAIYQDTGRFIGPLHGVPVLVKDQVATKDIRTTFGSAAFASYRPKEDATIVKRLRQAGAVVLAKTTMPDFAAGWFSFSSVSGETKNPYALDREPGGSSSGSAAGVSINMGLIGIGEDTGGSIRVPASFTGLFGLRVTTGMISRAGLSPLVHFQDTPGPLARTVRDAAVVLDVLAGYDGRDPFTTAALYRSPHGYAAGLSEQALRGARIGVLREAFGSDGSFDAAAVNSRVEVAIAAMKSAGADIIDPVSVPHLQEFVTATAMYAVQSKHDLNQFFRSLPDGPVASFDDLYASKQFHEMLDLFHDIAKGPAYPEAEPFYFKQRFEQERFRQALLNVLAGYRLDALLFPDVQVLPPKKSDLYAGRWTTLTFPTNTLIASQTGLPALSELIGKPYDERRLLNLAYAYEQAAQPRRTPPGFPRVTGEA